MADYKRPAPGTRKLSGIQVRSQQEIDAQNEAIEARKEAERAKRERVAFDAKLDAAINPESGRDSDGMMPLPDFEHLKPEEAQELMQLFAYQQMERLQKAAEQFGREHYESALKTLKPLLAMLDDLAKEGPDKDPNCFDFKDEVDVELAGMLNPPESPDGYLPTFGVQALAHELAADCYYYLDQADEGLAAADGALRWDPWNAQIHLRRASFLEMQRDFERLGEELERTYPLIARDLDMAAYHFYRGLYLLNTGKIPLAAAHFVAFKDFDTNHELADVDQILRQLDDQLHHPGVFEGLTSQEAQRRIRRAGDVYGPSETGINALYRALERAVAQGRQDAVQDLSARYRNLLKSKRDADRLDEILAGKKVSL